MEIETCLLGAASAVSCLGFLVGAACSRPWLFATPKDDGTPVPAPQNRKVEGPRNRRVGPSLKRTVVVAAASLWLGGCGLLPAAVQTTSSETATASGVNATETSTYVGGLYAGRTRTVPPGLARDCVRYFADSLRTLREAGMLPAPDQQVWWVAMQQQLLALQTPGNCLAYATNGVANFQTGMFGGLGMGFGPFPGGVRFKGADTRTAGDAR